MVNSHWQKMVRAVSRSAATVCMLQLLFPCSLPELLSPCMLFRTHHHACCTPVTGQHHVCGMALLLAAPPHTYQASGTHPPLLLSRSMQVVSEEQVLQNLLRVRGRH